MKKILLLFGFPLLLFCTLFYYGRDLAVKTGHIFVAVTNPIETARYAQSHNSAQKQGNENSFSADTAEAENSTAQSKDSLSPFEDFDINAVQPQSSTQGSTDYPIAEITYASQTNDVTYKKENCYVKNLTTLSAAEVKTELLTELPFKVEKNSKEPQILIMHTHATESYQNHPELYYDPEYSCRTTDVSKNMISVGRIIAEKLNEYGYNTLHDATLHDYPSYNESYGRSKKTVEEYLEKYPSIKVVLDVHRDAIERSDGTRIKPVAIINGKRYAQVMIISGADNGYLNMPNYKKNLRFASHFQNAMETMYPSLTRPILFDYRNYNQQLTTGSLLVEVGGHANTLEEAHNSAYLIARSLAAVFDKSV